MIKARLAYLGNLSVKLTDVLCVIKTLEWERGAGDNI
jgi:hypothetical protein